MPQPIDNIDLEFLSDTERDLILEVLRRDEELRQAEEQRIRKLKTELLEIKRKGAKRGSQRYSQRSCARCHGSLSLLAFSSNQCSHCRHLVCGKCRTSLADGSWLCTVCFKESDLRKSTGDWFYNLRVNRFSTTPGHELVRSSLRKRPPLKNYVTMGDVLLKQSESSRGPPVPVPRQKVGAIGNRPSSENSGSLNSLASFETKDGPLSEYSGSIASTSSYERKGIDGLFKPSQSDTESAEIFSLTSSKTGTESGRVTPDLSKRAILPPNYNQSSGTLLPDAVGIHSSSTDSNTVSEIKQAAPSQEFDVDKLFKKSVKRVQNSPDVVNSGPDGCDQPDSSEFSGDTKVPEIKRAIPNPEFDLDIKSIKNIENPEYANLELDVCDESHTYESLYEIKSQLVQGLDTQVPEIDQTIPNPEFRVETNVQPVESPPECLNYGLDVCIQSSTYVSQEEIESTIIQGLDRQVSEKNQVSASPQFDVDELYTKCVKHVEEPPESVKHGLDSCDQTVTHAVPVAVKRQFPQGSDMQVPEIKQASPQPEFNVEQECIKNIENPPECVKYEPDVCDRPGSFKRPVPAKRHFLQGLETQVPDIKHVCPSPELDAKKLFKRSVTRTQNPPEHQSALDLHENRDTLVIPMGNRSQSVPDLEMQEAEEEDIDSLVDNHLSAMASSSSRSTSMTSIYSGSGDNFSLDIRGEVIFTMYYDDDNQSLQVLIKECRKLTFGDTVRQTTNPYVKCYLLPDKSRQSKRKTTIKRHTCDPVYEETFKYSIRRNQLLTRSMLISVWHHGHLSSNPFLGEVEIALDCYDLDSRMEECMALMTKAPCCIPATAFNQFKGELVISLKYVTPKGPQMQKTKSFSLIPPGKKVVEVAGGELHVLIKEAKNLIAMKGTGGTSDSFVKGYLFPSKSKTNKRKTPVVKKNLNPHYGHTFVYKELTLDQLKTMCLELTVWDKEPMLSNEFLGGVRLSSGEGSVKIGNNNVGMDSVGEEVSLWQKMMQYPDSWAEGSLPLRTTMRKKKDK
ncbi:synaptotagmin-like protein 4 isoform X19 [Corythoichthys intestinalis]|uniref:synaptotagmin-like protein 4 isoform X19 n=1 Tax=Corythoichthys intestinalis TaxID=161448 RepID=UPI0025A67FC2|nr:synaptotagmin-like protein 4 isoform X19 [Corythoichthys intestinalis]